MFKWRPGFSTPQTTPHATSVPIKLWTGARKLVLPRNLPVHIEGVFEQTFLLASSFQIGNVNQADLGIPIRHILDGDVLLVDLPERSKREVEHGQRTHREFMGA
jgi:hypothetical protein